MAATFNFFSSSVSFFNTSLWVSSVFRHHWVINAAATKSCLLFNCLLSFVVAHARRRTAPFMRSVPIFGWQYSDTVVNKSLSSKFLCKFVGALKLLSSRRCWLNNDTSFKRPSDRRAGRPTCSLAAGLNPVRCIFCCSSRIACCCCCCFFSLSFLFWHLRYV